MKNIDVKVKDWGHIRPIFITVKKGGVSFISRSQIYGIFCSQF